MHAVCMLYNNGKDFPSMQELWMRQCMCWQLGFLCTMQRSFSVEARDVSAHGSQVALSHCTPSCAALWASRPLAQCAWRITSRFWR